MSPLHMLMTAFWVVRIIPILLPVLLDRPSKLAQVLVMGITSFMDFILLPNCFKRYPNQPLLSNPHQKISFRGAYRHNYVLAISMALSVFKN